MATGPLVRVEEAGLGPTAQVRLVVSGVSDPHRLRGVWASSGATVEWRDDRLHAVTTVEALSRAAGRCLPQQESAALDASLRSAVAAWGGPAPAVPLPGGTLPTHTRPLIMGVVNVTPDSFSDGGVLYPAGHPDAAVAHARSLIAEGADLVDVGGESTRPGAAPVEEAEELARTVPVVLQLAADDVIVSIDTTKPAVALAAVRAGATVINDVSGATRPDLLHVAASCATGYVLMHTRGTPADMQSQAHYGDVVAEVYEYLAQGLERCSAAGIPAERILVDPGLGFAKTVEHNLALLHGLRQLRGLGRPVVVGASRKSFLGRLLDGAGVEGRLEGSLACAAATVAAGGAVVRAHDVAPTERVVRVSQAIAAGVDAWAR